MSKDKKIAKYNTLIYSISRGSTNEARELLNRLAGQEAKNVSDLEIKLAQFYLKSNDKVSLEKQLAEIHPHKDFILRYLAPKKEEVITLNTGENSENEKTSTEGVVVHNGYSSANGEQYSKCEGCSGTCGSGVQKMSGADGSGSQQVISGRNDTVLVLGLVSIVAMFGLVIINNKK